MELTRAWTSEKSVITCLRLEDKKIKQTIAICFLFPTPIHSSYNVRVFPLTFSSPTHFLSI